MIHPRFRQTLAESARYMLIGTLASAIDCTCYILLSRLLGVWFIFANLISVNIGVTVSFFLNTFRNFKKPERLFARAFSFYAICYIGLALSMVILWISTSALKLPDIPAKIIAMATVGILQFFLNKTITFRE